MIRNVYVSRIIFYCRSLEGRLNVKTRDYIAKYKLGDPIAGNYYEAKYDDFVPTLMSQFKSNDHV